MNLLTLIEKYWGALWPRRGLILLIGLPLGILMGIQAFFTPPTYTTKSVFLPDSGGNSMMGSIDNPLSLILGNQTEGSDQLQMLQIMQSRMLNEAVAADSIETESGKVWVAEKILELYASGFSLKGWVIGLFIKDEPMSQRTKVVTAGKILSGLMNAESNDNGFIEMTFSCLDNKVAGPISYKYIEHLRSYYNDQRTQKAKLNVEFFAQRADSVKRELDKVNYSLARNLDQNQFRIRATSEVYPAELRAKQEILKEMYISLGISREQAVAQLQQSTPVIQVLDSPEPPFDRKGKSWLKWGVIGWFLGSLLFALWMTRKLWIEDVSVLIKQLLSGQPAGEEQ